MQLSNDAKLKERTDEESEHGMEHNDVVDKLLDTAKVRIELKRVSDERDLVNQQLLEKEESLNLFKAENESLQEQINELSNSKESLQREFTTTEMKLKAIMEYFEQKEMQLHRKIGEEEMVRQRVEFREAHAKEVLEIAESDRERDRYKILNHCYHVSWVWSIVEKS